MELKIGLCYKVLLNDGIVVEFKFTGNDLSENNHLQVLIDGEMTNLYEILKYGFLSFEEIECK